MSADLKGRIIEGLKVYADFRDPDRTNPLLNSFFRRLGVERKPEEQPKNGKRLSRETTVSQSVPSSTTIHEPSGLTEKELQSRIEKRRDDILLKDPRRTLEPSNVCEFTFTDLWEGQTSPFKIYVIYFSRLTGRSKQARRGPIMSLNELSWFENRKEAQQYRQEVLAAYSQYEREFSRVLTDIERNLGSADLIKKRAYQMSLLRQQALPIMHPLIADVVSNPRRGDSKNDPVQDPIDLQASFHRQLQQATSYGSVKAAVSKLKQSMTRAPLQEETVALLLSKAYELPNNGECKSLRQDIARIMRDSSVQEIAQSKYSLIANDGEHPGNRGAVNALLPNPRLSDPIVEAIYGSYSDAARAHKEIVSRELPNLQPPKKNREDLADFLKGVRIVTVGEKYAISDDQLLNIYEAYIETRGGRGSTDIPAPFRSISIKKGDPSFQELDREIILFLGAVQLPETQLNRCFEVALNISLMGKGQALSHAKAYLANAPINEVLADTLTDYYLAARSGSPEWQTVGKALEGYVTIPELPDATVIALRTPLVSALKDEADRRHEEVISAILSNTGEDAFLTTLMGDRQTSFGTYGDVLRGYCAKAKVPDSTTTLIADIDTVERIDSIVHTNPTLSDEQFNQVLNRYSTLEADTPALDNRLISFIMNNSQSSSQAERTLPILLKLFGSENEEISANARACLNHLVTEETDRGSIVGPASKALVRTSLLAILTDENDPRHRKVASAMLKSTDDDLFIVESLGDTAPYLRTHGRVLKAHCVRSISNAEEPTALIESMETILRINSEAPRIPTLTNEEFVQWFNRYTELRSRMAEGHEVLDKNIISYIFRTSLNTAQAERALPILFRLYATGNEEVSGLAKESLDRIARTAINKDYLLEAATLRSFARDVRRVFRGNGADETITETRILKMASAVFDKKPPVADKDGHIFQHTNNLFRQSIFDLIRSPLFNQEVSTRLAIIAQGAADSPEIQRDALEVLNRALYYPISDLTGIRQALAEDSNFHPDVRDLYINVYSLVAPVYQVQKDINRY